MTVSDSFMQQKWNKRDSHYCHGWSWNKRACFWKTEIMLNWNTLKIFYIIVLRLYSNSLSMAVFLQRRQANWNLKLSKWKSTNKLIFLFKIICLSPHSNDLSVHLFFSECMGQDAFSCFLKRNFSYDTNFSASNTYLFQEVCRKK
jgi:hypothetical protein